MMLSKTNIVLAMLLAFVIILSIALRVDYSKPNYEFLLESQMKYSPAYSAFDKNRVLPNKQTLQNRVPGTIARGETPLHYGPGPQEALRAGKELVNPISKPQKLILQNFQEKQGWSEAQKKAAQAKHQAITKKNQAAYQMKVNRYKTSVQHGLKQYQIYCSSCHGTSGKGDGLVSKRGFPPPPSLLIGKSTQMQDGQLFHIITYGQGSMPPMAPQLSPKTRWDVVNYIRSIQPPLKQKP